MAQVLLTERGSKASHLLPAHPPRPSPPSLHFSSLRRPLRCLGSPRCLAACGASHTTGVVDSRPLRGVRETYGKDAYTTTRDNRVTKYERCHDVKGVKDETDVKDVKDDVNIVKGIKDVKDIKDVEDAKHAKDARNVKDAEDVKMSRI